MNLLFLLHFLASTPVQPYPNVTVPYALHKRYIVKSYLHEVLTGHGVPAVLLAVGEVEDGGRPVGKEPLADDVQHLGRRRDRLDHLQVGDHVEVGGDGALHWR